ncbi:alpha/beta hydrolase [Flavihumibacter petaseus]|nr:alpha/beta hydrolase [Flavihumibacter petaseus]
MLTSCIVMLFSSLQAVAGDTTFSKLSVTKQLEYYEAGKDEKQKFYRYDWYEGKGDQRSKRPLLINLHGGGFKIGNKSGASTPFFSRTYARAGFVTASINYRKSRKRPLKFEKDLREACFDATEDLDKAIRYFKAHADELRIDTNRIFLAGNSAGAMVALQYVFSNHIPAQPVRAIANCWGAIFDTLWIERSSVPIVSVYGTRDRVVPPDVSGEAIFGSASIHREANRIQLINSVLPFERCGHELHRHFNPLFAGFGAKKRWKQAGAFICDFLKAQL